MRLALAVLAAPALAAPAAADSEASWDAFRDRVANACLALVEGPGAPSVEVNPFGSEHYGVAIVTVAAPYGTDRLACVFDKATGAAELTGAFLPPTPGTPPAAPGE